MKTVIASLFLLLALGLVVSAQNTVTPAKKPYERYAQFIEDTRVELSDGAVWMMDKGDCFPIYMFKEQQTKVVLKIASATFQVDAVNLKVLPESENEMALVSYRKNLAQYLNKQPDVWTTEAKKQKAATKETKSKEKAAAQEKK